jgi:hypothetical protein
MNEIKNLHLESLNMTRKEFDNRLKELELEFDKSKKALLVNFALSNNTIAVGDVVRDHIGRGMVEKIQTTMSLLSKYSEMRYWCVELKKDGAPKKNGDSRWVYQSNIKEVNGEPYNYDTH